jgi:hypothetical protein
LTEDDAKQYLEEVFAELKKSKRQKTTLAKKDPDAKQQ